MQCEHYWTRIIDRNRSAATRDKNNWQQMEESGRAGMIHDVTSKIRTSFIYADESGLFYLARLLVPI